LLQVLRHVPIPAWNNHAYGQVWAAESGQRTWTESREQTVNWKNSLKPL